MNQSLENSILSIEEVKSCIHGEYFNRDLHLRWSNSPPFYSMLTFLDNKVQFSSTPNTQGFTVGVLGEFTGYISFYSEDKNVYTRIQAVNNIENTTYIIPEDKPTSTNQFLKGTNSSNGVNLSWDDIFTEQEILYVDKVCVDKVTVDVDDVATDVINHLTYDLKKMKVFTSGAPSRLPCVTDASDCCNIDPEYPIPKPNCGWELPSILYFKPLINDFVNYWYLNGNAKNLSYRDLWGVQPNGMNYWNNCLDDSLQIMPHFLKNMMGGMFQRSIQNIFLKYTTDTENNFINILNQPDCSFYDIFNIGDIPMFYMNVEDNSSTKKSMLQYFKSILNKYKPYIITMSKHPAFKQWCMLSFNCGVRNYYNILGINPFNFVDIGRDYGCSNSDRLVGGGLFSTVDEFFNFWDNADFNTQLSFFNTWLFPPLKSGFPGTWRGIYTSDTFVKVPLTRSFSGGQWFPYLEPYVYVPKLSIEVGIGCHYLGEVSYRSGTGNILSGFKKSSWSFGQNCSGPPNLGYPYDPVSSIDFFRPCDYCVVNNIAYDVNKMSPRYSNDNINKIYYPNYPFTEYYYDSDTMELGNYSVSLSISYVYKRTSNNYGIFQNIGCKDYYMSLDSSLEEEYTDNYEYISAPYSPFSYIEYINSSQPTVISAPKVVDNKFNQYFMETTNCPALPFKIYSKQDIRTV